MMLTLSVVVQCEYLFRVGTPAVCYRPEQVPGGGKEAPEVVVKDEL